MNKNIKRCNWAGREEDFYLKYHDEEWGVPVHNDLIHFEMLLLEGAQAGLSWRTILQKRENYRKAFKNFDPKEVAIMEDQELEHLLLNSGIIKNRLKIFGARKNAKVFLDIQKEFGSFNNYVWNFVDGKPKINAWNSADILPSSTPESEFLSKDLKKRGMIFVGPTIIYSYMQAVGIVNDHIIDCFRYNRV